MNSDFFLPASAKLGSVIGAFAFFLVVFDLVLVRWLKLGKVAWKRVDYVWLGFAAFGLIGSVAQVRISSASAQLGLFEQRATTAFNDAKSLVDFYATKPGVICRTFVRSEHSAPPDQFQRMQHEYDVACQWITQFAKAIPSRPPNPITRIDQSILPPRPEVTDSALKGKFRGLDRQFGFFNQRVDELEIVRARAGATATEQTIVYLWPFLLAFALALRITKVTGEIRFEP